MKVTITHLKAPWPADSKVGDVVDLGDDVMSVPPQFLGKCIASVAEAPAADPDELKATQALLKAAQEEAAELRGRVERTEAALEKMGSEREALAAERDQLKATLEAGKGKK